ncbi:hypothetical protein I308_104274 [Cryptococcus tetragattii IND107]|uniref:Uncharacterized protein n=1 Tax=Cryptococcus tetragattii IND107 TaxID=1296105 RepID=A0ABR3BSC8_9TREE
MSHCFSNQDSLDSHCSQLLSGNFLSYLNKGLSQFTDQPLLTTTPSIAGSFDYLDPTTRNTAYPTLFCIIGCFHSISINISISNLLVFYLAAGLPSSKDTGLTKLHLCCHITNIVTFTGLFGPLNKRFKFTRLGNARLEASIRFYPAPGRGFRHDVLEPDLGGMIEGGIRSPVPSALS